MSKLLRLIYVSRTKGAMGASEPEGLLSQARSNNEKVGLTGILCTGRGYFVQALEGPENEVLKTYTKILVDERHRESSLLSVGLVSSRVFSEWAMAHVAGELLGGDLHARLVGQVVLERDLSEPLKLLQSTLKSLRRAA
jgi:Sensors of blue-light using FAD